MLHIDGVNWKVSEFGSQAVLLEPIIEEGNLEYIHKLFHILEFEDNPLIIDLVPAYTSIAIFYSSSKKEVLEYLEHLDFSTLDAKQPSIIHVNVNYAKGLDWDRVIKITGLSKSEVIERHTKPTYTVAMIGFIPGFLFLEGLESILKVPRLDSPRTNIPAGSVGIGAHQTGIYSLESPGGWNIIGQSNHPFFDVNQTPPITISLGDKLKFNAV